MVKVGGGGRDILPTSTLIPIGDFILLFIVILIDLCNVLLFLFFYSWIKHVLWLHDLPDSEIS